MPRPGHSYYLPNPLTRINRLCAASSSWPRPVSTSVSQWRAGDAALGGKAMADATHGDALVDRLAVRIEHVVGQALPGGLTQSVGGGRGVVAAFSAGALPKPPCQRGLGFLPVLVVDMGGNDGECAGQHAHVVGITEKGGEVGDGVDG